MTTSRTVVLTGASSGIGAVAARELAAAGWDVAVVGRNPERTAKIATEVGGMAFVADYDRLSEVRTLAKRLLERYPRIDALAGNAGGLVGKRGETADGHERTFQHNVLAPFLLTSLLLDRLIESDARVVNTASVANRLGKIRLDDLESRRRPYLGGWRAYGTAKLETILLTRELSKRTGLTAYSFHPGSVGTEFGKDTAVGRILMRLISVSQISPEAGAVPLIQLVSNPEIAAPAGTYFDRLTPNGPTARQAGDEGLSGRLWDAVAAIVAPAGAE